VIDDDITLPVDYTLLSSRQRRIVREVYVTMQNGNCYYCEDPIRLKPGQEIEELPINWELFPPFFLRHPVHLQHNHETNMTEGAVHARCNAVMWQYEGR